MLKGYYAGVEAAVQLHIIALPLKLLNNYKCKHFYRDYVRWAYVYEGKESKQEDGMAKRTIFYSFTNGGS